MAYVVTGSGGWGLAMQRRELGANGLLQLIDVLVGNRVFEVDYHGNVNFKG
jgi:hypothetical protein